MKMSSENPDSTVNPDNSDDTTDVSEKYTITPSVIYTLLSGYIEGITNLDSRILKLHMSEYTFERLKIIRYGAVWDKLSVFRWFDRADELLDSLKVAEILDGLDTYLDDLRDNILENCYYMKTNDKFYAVCQLNTTSYPLYVACEYTNDMWKVVAFFSTKHDGFMDAQPLWKITVAEALSDDSQVEADVRAMILEDYKEDEEQSRVQDDDFNPETIAPLDTGDEVDEPDDYDYWRQYDEAMMNEDEDGGEENVTASSVKEEYDSDDDGYYERYDNVESTIGDKDEEEQDSDDKAIKNHIEESIISLHAIAKSNGMSTLEFHKTVFQSLGNIGS